jgi:hypothetical protein
MSVCLIYSPHKINFLYHHFLKCIHGAFRSQYMSEVWTMNKFAPYLCPTKSMLSNPLYHTHMTVMYVAFPFSIFVTTSSSDWARDSNSINTTKYDWPGLYYTRLGQITINFNRTRLCTTTIIHLAPSWHISHHGLHTHIIRAPASDIHVGLYALVAQVQSQIIYIYRCSALVVTVRGRGEKLG